MKAPPRPETARRRRPYRAPQIVEIALDPHEALLSPCTSQVVSSPPCPPPSFSVNGVRRPKGT